jgi:cytochrome P450
MPQDDEQLSHDIPIEIASKDGQLDPYPFFERMRDKHPVRYDSKRDICDVFTYDEVLQVLENEDKFTKVDAAFFSKSMAGLRNPEYDQAKRMGVDDYLTPGAVSEYRPKVVEMVEDTLDQALSGDGTFDFVEKIAKPLPVMVIADLLGVPEDRMDTFREWSLALTEAPPEFTSEAINENNQKRAETAMKMEKFFNQLLSEREEKPQEDLLTRFTQWENKVEFLTREHTVAISNALLLAGNVTTTSLLTNAVWVFSQEGLINDIQAGTIQLEPAIEEVLRYYSPVMRAKRTATEDVTLGEVEIEEGTTVIGWISSAHRDERAFDDPNSFDPTRSPTSQTVPFGKGMRFCWGAHLARLEAKLVLQHLLDRVNDFTLQTERPEPFISAEVFTPKELTLSIET